MMRWVWPNLRLSRDASSCQAPWRPARKIAGVRKSLTENSKGLSVSSDFLSDTENDVLD